MNDILPVHGTLASLNRQDGQCTFSVAFQYWDFFFPGSLSGLYALLDTIEIMFLGH